jgi:hypothetical protein
MNQRWTSAVVIGLLQGGIVLGLTGQAARNRQSLPRAVAPAISQNPSGAIHGRYLTVSLSAVAAEGVAPRVDEVAGRKVARRVPVSLEARDGRLIARPAGAWHVSLGPSGDRVGAAPVLWPAVEYYLPVGANPRPLLARGELWAEVSVPRAGPPRVVGLGTMSDGTFVRLW